MAIKNSSDRHVAASIQRTGVLTTVQPLRLPNLYQRMLMTWFEAKHGKVVMLILIRNTRLAAENDILEVLSDIKAND